MKEMKWVSLLLLVGLFLGCEKEYSTKNKVDNEIIDKFFSYNSLKNSEQTLKDKFTKLSINELKAYNEKVNFIPEFTNELGFADWEDARYFETSHESVLQIPVLFDNDNKVEALIVIVQADDYFNYYVIRRNSYDEFIDNKEPKLTLNKVIELFTLADFRIFGKSNYLPNGKVYYVGEQSSPQLKSSVLVENCYHQEVWIDGEMYSHTIHCEYDLEYQNDLKIPDGFNGGGSPGGGGGRALHPSPAPVPAPENPINDVEDYFQCLDVNIPATMVIYIDQPVANSDQVMSLTGDVGHCFVGLMQGDNTSIFGFYPEKSGKPGSIDSGVLGNDANHHFDVSISIQISSSQLSSVMNYVVGNNNGYDLDNYNCTDFAIQVAALGGLSLPDSFSSWGFGGGSNPAALGQDVRNLNLSKGVNRDATGGDAPANSNTCND